MRGGAERRKRRRPRRVTVRPHMSIHFCAEGEGRCEAARSGGHGGVRAETRDGETVTATNTATRRGWRSTLMCKTRQKTYEPVGKSSVLVMAWIVCVGVIPNAKRRQRRATARTHRGWRNCCECVMCIVGAYHCNMAADGGGGWRPSAPAINIINM